MKIVVIGGSGLVGSKVVGKLRARGQEVVSASLKEGVNILTGEGLAEALAGAEVVVDVANSPSFEDKAALEFFETAGKNIRAAEVVAGVKHHVALSVVGTDRLQAGGYFRAKMAQEALITGSTVPYTIVHATQFFEFMGAIAQTGGSGQTLTLTTAALQPIASDDVAEAMADAALDVPRNGTIEIGGPERAPVSDFVRRYLRASGDGREVVDDPRGPYYGIPVDDRSLVPGEGARIGATRFEDWLDRTRPPARVQPASKEPMQRA